LELSRWNGDLFEIKPAGALPEYLATDGSTADHHFRVTRREDFVDQAIDGIGITGEAPNQDAIIETAIEALAILLAISAALRIDLQEPNCYRKVEVELFIGLNPTLHTPQDVGQRHAACMPDISGEVNPYAVYIRHLASVFYDQAQ
jgi:hypothetical protein